MHTHLPQPLSQRLLLGRLPRQHGHKGVLLRISGCGLGQLLLLDKHLAAARLALALGLNVVRPLRLWQELGDGGLVQAEWLRSA